MAKKKSLIFCLLIIIFYLFGCAPRLAPPPLYQGMDISLEEVLTGAGHDIDTLKAVADVTIEKNNAYYTSIAASLLIKRPGLVRMRIYKFGMLMDDILIRENEVHFITGKRRPWLEHVGREFYQSIFWWDSMRDASVAKKGSEYIIRTDGKEMRLDNGSLFPLRQVIRVGDKAVHIRYSKPMIVEDRWFPSFIGISMDGVRFSISIEKLDINPETGEMDFRLP